MIGYVSKHSKILFLFLQFFVSIFLEEKFIYIYNSSFSLANIKNTQNILPTPSPRLKTSINFPKIFILASIIIIVSLLKFFCTFLSLVFGK